MPLLVMLGFVTLVIATVDWWAVWVSHRGVERLAKPLVMLMLITLALAIDADPEVARWLVIAGLSAGLVGDVLLLPEVDKFLYGLGAFLVGHVFYVAALATMPLAAIGIIGGIAAALALLTYLAWPIVKGVRGTPFAVPVIVYMGAVAALIVVGTATHRWPIAIGGVLFAVSDGLLGLDRFVRPAPRRRVVVHVLYHLGQAGIVLGL